MLMDRRGFGERSDAVLRTATPGDDGGEKVAVAESAEKNT
jgi:hypothetical protein